MTFHFQKIRRVQNECRDYWNRSYICRTERMTGEEIANLADIPVHIVKSKMGINEKIIAGKDDHTVQMGIRAAKEAIQNANIDPREIDVIIYIGEEHKEYPLWTAAIKIQEEIGALNAWAFDAQLRCGTTIMGMKLAKSLMLSDDTLRLYYWLVDIVIMISLTIKMREQDLCLI